jgi:hypothetical protein
MQGSKTTASILIVSIVTVLGASLALQGWKSRIPTYDTLIDIDNAHELLVHGQRPFRGVLTSFASYSSPAEAWLMAPGVLMFKDPRLFSYIGSIAIYLGTLLGVFFLADTYFGRECAQLAVILYSLSKLGLEVADDPSQRYPIHFFYVWMVYWTVQWVRKKDARYLAAAIVTFAIGLNVFLEIAPALFLLFAVWIYYRPPLRIRPLLIAAFLVAIVWYPYIRFEMGRGFVDLKSQVLRQRILPADFGASWCDPNLAPKSWHHDADQVSKSAPLSRLRGFVLSRGGLILGTLDTPRSDLVLIPLTIVALGLLSLDGFSRPKANGTESLALLSNRLKWLAIVIILSAVVLNEVVIGRIISDDGFLQPGTISTVRKCQTLLIMVAAAILVLKDRFAAGLNRLQPDRASQGDSHFAEAGVCVISLIVPLIALLALIEGLFRIWWLWPVEIVILASLATYWPLRLRTPRFCIWIGSSILIVYVVTNSFLISRLNSWMTQGWSGTDAEEVRVVDYVAKQIASRGKDHAAIGYDLFVMRFWAAFNAADSHYKVGADMDLLFRYRYGIVNTSRCAEGTSKQDTYRIVQTRALAPYAIDHIDIPLDSSFKLLQKFDSYQVLQRPEDGTHVTFATSSDANHS